MIKMEGAKEFSNEHLYIQGDGDNIRERVEYYLLNGEMDELTKLSDALIEAINSLKTIAIKTMDADVIVAGGDDLLLRVENTKYQREYIEHLAESYKLVTGSTISFGIGRTAELAYLSLRRAKASGNGMIIENQNEQ